MIFFNIGWMRNYEGPSPSDIPKGGHGHLKTAVRASEEFNFSPIGDKLYGYRPTSKHQIKIEKLGADPKAQSVNNITVVWMALRPGSKDTVIVGWYKNATVFRHAQPFRTQKDIIARIYPGYENPVYMVTAEEKDCTILPTNSRTFQIPSSRRVEGSFGQSPTFYDKYDIFRSNVHKYIDQIDHNILTSKSKRGTRNSNPEQRKTIENIAVEHAISYFISAGGGSYDVERVEHLAKGWDLECTRGSEIIYVEVKGRSGNQTEAELTPNEFSKMMNSKYKRKYVIYIVTDCLGDFPQSNIFWHATEAIWKTDDERILEIVEKPGAVVSF